MDKKLRQAQFLDKETGEITVIDGVIEITVDTLGQQVENCPAGVVFVVYCLDEANGMTTDLFVSGQMYKLVNLEALDNEYYRNMNEMMYGE